MNAKTLKALKSSIEHWRRMASGKPRIGEVPTGSNCALCKALFNNKDGFCFLCPVRIKTGYSGCSGTPYRKARLEFEHCGINSLRFRNAAKLELKFLESLLP